MFKKDIKIFLFFIFSLCACKSDNKIKNNSNDFVKNHFAEYSDVYKTINDSINLYINSSLKDVLFICTKEWEVDSLICINSKNNFLVATINKSNGKAIDAASDVVSGLLGKKIEGKWYFFKGGGNLIVPREMYGKTEMNPLTFHELSQIARKEFLESALIKNEKGDYIVDDKWIDNHFYYNGMCANCKTQAQYDSTHWYKIIHKWSEKIDTNQYKPLHKNKISGPAL